LFFIYFFVEGNSGLAYKDKQSQHFIGGLDWLKKPFCCCCCSAQWRSGWI